MNPTNPTTLHRKVVELDSRLTERLVKLRHKGPRNQAWTVEQYYSSRSAPVLFFPHGYTPRAGDVAHVLVKRDVRFYVSHKLWREHLKDTLTDEIICEEGLLEDNPLAETLKISPWDRPRTVVPYSDLERIWGKLESGLLEEKLWEHKEKISRGEAKPHGSKWALYFKPFEPENVKRRPDWAITLVSGKTRHTGMGAYTVTRFDIPPEAIIIAGENMSSTGNHGEIFRVVIAPRGTVIKKTVSKRSNLGNVAPTKIEEVVV